MVSITGDIKMYAYKGKILRLNLSKKTARVEEVPENLFRKYLGGRGFGAKIYYDEVKPDVNPLEPENKVVLVTGPLTGTPTFGSSKCHLVTKSPLTEIYLCSNAGGYFGAELKFAGYDGIVIEGRASNPIYVSIKDDRVEFNDAKHIWGMDVWETQQVVKEETGDDKTRVMCIGPAGERLVRFACVMSEDRSFGRGGAGAVMGSKNLKAIAVRGSSKMEIAELDKLKQLLRASAKTLKEMTRGHTLYGTSQYTEIIYEVGAYPIMHYRQTTHEEIENLFGSYLRKGFWVKDTRCFGCPIACGKLYEVKEGPPTGVRSKPEYETIWSLGANCGVFDHNSIIAATDICNRYGVDAITAGYLIGFVMELYMRKILSRETIDGIKARFGSDEAVLELLRKMCLREGFGDLLAEGSRKAGQAIGKNAPSYAMQVKGMELTAYEPRAFHGIGLSYATSSRGACHNVGGWTIRAELIKKTADRYATKGKGKLVKTIQDVRGYIDFVGICTIPRRALGLTDEPNENILKYATGLDFTNQLLKIGERVYNLERLILVREGITRKDDDLPPRIKTEPLPDGPAKGHRITQTMLDEMLNEYYDVRGWDRRGKPTPEKLEELDLLPP